MMIFKTILKTTSVALSVLGSCFLISSSASATYSYYWDVEADAGSFEPVVLGDDISLDACGSDLFVVSYSSYRSSICNLTNISLFSVNWFAKNVGTGAFTWLTGGLGTNENIDLSTIPTGTAAANSQTTTTTGAGSFFSSIGTYAIGAYVAGTNYAGFSETVSNGTHSVNLHANFSGDSTNSLAMAESWNGELNNGANWGGNFEVTAATSVPEPETLLILLPALTLLGLRERRRRRKLVAAA